MDVKQGLLELTANFSKELDAPETCGFDVSSEVPTLSQARRIEKALGEWVYRNGKNATCGQLLELLREQGFHKIADYLENNIPKARKEIQIYLNILQSSEGQQMLEEFIEAYIAKRNLVLENANTKTMDSEQPLLHDSHHVSLLSIPQSKIQRHHSALPIEGDQKKDSLRGDSDTEGSKQWRIFRSQTFIYAVLGFSIIFVAFGLVSLTAAILIYRQSTWEPGIQTIPQSEGVLTTSADVPQTTDSYKDDFNYTVNACTTNVSKRGGKTAYINRVSPDWTLPVLDFCYAPETQLVVMEEDIFEAKKSPTLLCPGRVTGLEIFVPVSGKGIEKLLTNFCDVKNITLVGNDVCQDIDLVGGNQGPKVIANTLTYLKWDDLKMCGNVYELFARRVVSPHLTRMEFSCVTFDDSDFGILDRIIKQSPEIDTILCEDDDICEGLNLKSKHGVTVITERTNCDNIMHES